MSQIKQAAISLTLLVVGLLSVGLAATILLDLLTARQWSIAVSNRSGAPCTLIVTLGTYYEGTLQFDNIAAQDSDSSQTLVAERGSTTIRTIKVVGSDSQERVLRVNEELRGGRELLIRIDEQLMISTEIDYGD